MGHAFRPRNACQHLLQPLRILLATFGLLASKDLSIGAPPFAATQTAAPITTTTARLNGMVTPNGFPSIAWFEWNAQGSPRQPTTPMDVGSGSHVVHVTKIITDLSPMQSYRFRLVVSNASGVTAGPEKAFVTGGRLAGWGGNTYGQAVPPPGLVSAVAAACDQARSIALRPDGTIRTWGFNWADLNNVPLRATNVASVDASPNIHVVLRSDGTVVRWGTQTNTPADWTNIIAVATGWDFTIALRDNGTISVTGALTNSPADLTNVVEISAGYYFGLALRNDGTVVAWGQNQFGETNVPTGLSNIIAIAAGAVHSLALREDGTIAAWGYSPEGGTNAPAGLTNVFAVGAGWDNSLALLNSGKLISWGRNDGGATNIPPGLTNVSAIASGGFNHFAIGPNSAPSANPQAVSGVANSDVVIVLKGSDVNGDALQFRIAALPPSGALYQVNAGARGPRITSANTLVTDPASRVIYSAPAATNSGIDAFSFVANDAIADSLPASIMVEIVATPYGTTRPATAVTTSRATLNGMATANGWNSVVWFEWGKDGMFDQRTSATDIGSGAGCVHVSAELTNLDPNQIYNFRIVLSNAADVVRGFERRFQTGAKVSAWGSSNATLNLPPGLSNVVEVAAGPYHALALRNDGHVIAWGSGAATNVPGTLSNVVSIAAGENITVAIQSNGKVTSWGGNGFPIPATWTNVIDVAATTGLALRKDGTLIDSGSSIVLSNVVAVSSGLLRTVALRNDGKVIPLAGSPTNVPANVDDVVAISAGGLFCVALRRDGSVVDWAGEPEFPVSVPPGLSNVIGLAAGVFRCAALRRDGTVISWGTETNVPSYLTNVAALSAGWDYTLALANNQRPTLTNQLPIGSPGSWVGPANVPLLIRLQGSDLNGDALSFRITVPPTNGMLHQYSNGLPGAVIGPGNVVQDSLGRVFLCQ